MARDVCEGAVGALVIERDRTGALQDGRQRHWRDGPSGALRMGVVHRGWCVGCCWGLMAALFALGVMSLTWMVAIAALIAVEKLLRWEKLANRLVAVTLLALALGVAFAPRHVPGLTLPHSASAVKAT